MTPGRCASVATVSSAAPSSFSKSSSVDLSHDKTHGLASLLRRTSTPGPSRRLARIRPGNKMSSPTLSISTAEFEALPSSIQRKYFSSEERLAIVQRSAAEKRQRHTSKKSTSTIESNSPAVLPKRRKTIQKSDTKLQRRSSLPSVWNADIPTSGSDPAWFDSLPDKVKRSQFSKQEIQAIDARKTSDVEERPRTSSGLKSTLDTFSWDTRPKLRQKTSFHSPSVSISPSTCSNQTTRSAPHASRPLSPLSIASSSQLESRSRPASPAVPALTLTKPRERIHATKRPSTRRPFLLQPLPLPPPVLAPAAYTPSHDTSTYNDMIKALGSGSSVLLDETVDVDEETTPTQEIEHGGFNETTLPPAWYDEKLDFDFDSDHHHKQSTSTNTFSEQPRTISPSISDATSCDTSGPMTPSSPAAHPTHAFDHSISRLPPLPQSSHSSNAPDSFGHNSGITNFSHPQGSTYREASPRLKPSRQGPRHLVDGFYENQHNQPYSITIYHSKEDPLALDTLPVCDDLTGAHGAFAVSDEHHARGLRKVLKVIRGH